VLLKLGNNLLLVGDGKRGGAENGDEFGVPLEDVGQLVERPGSGFESGSFGGCGVL
jgi:hypothetical protein